jgi:hypothetical protein
VIDGHPYRAAPDAPPDGYRAAWARLRTLRFLAFAALLLMVPATLAAGFALGDSGLLVLLVFGVLFALFSKLARDFPCPNCGVPFAAVSRRRLGLLGISRRGSLVRRSCRSCGIRLGTSEAAAREAAAVTAREASAGTGTAQAAWPSVRDEDAPAENPARMTTGPRRQRGRGRSRDDASDAAGQARRALKERLRARGTASEPGTEPVSSRHTIDWRIAFAIGFMILRAVLSLAHTGRH